MSNYLATVTIGDFVGPETLVALSIAEEEQDTEFLSEEQAGYIMHKSMTQWPCWKELWLYGIIVDDDMEYYIPDDFDTEIDLITLDRIA